MKKDQIEALLMQACRDCIIEIECQSCGVILFAEPDAEDLFCEVCETKTRNPLIALGFI
ncbi:MAG: hypothetical protein JRI74_09185 [Deltaproteobacteria bacterium]|nr:hypothetical protein [Deltaproteobacteria bacterium]